MLAHEGRFSELDDPICFQRLSLNLLIDIWGLMADQQDDKEEGEWWKND